jgi:hypothetical protein
MEIIKCQNLVGEQLWKYFLYIFGTSRHFSQPSSSCHAPTIEEEEGGSVSLMTQLLQEVQR